MSNNRNILLICTAGITTGLLVKNMSNAAEQRGLKFNIFSTSATKAKDIMGKNDMDAVLVGPQAEQDVKKIEKYFDSHNIPFRIITHKSYERLDGEGVLEEALLLLNK